MTDKEQITVDVEKYQYTAGDAVKSLMSEGSFAIKVNGGFTMFEPTGLEQAEEMLRLMWNAHERREKTVDKGKSGDER